MAQIATLVTGAGVVTVIAGQSQAEQFLLLGDVDTAMPLQGLQVEIDGVPFINVVNQPSLLAAFSKWCMQTINGTGVIGILLKIASGRIGRNTTYRLTNNGATTPAIYAFSDNENGIPLLVGTKQINASSYEDFAKFSALFIGTPANLSSAEIVFSNGTKATLTQFELDAWFAVANQSEANGELGAVTVVDNRQQLISSIRLNCSAANTILVAKIPDASFQVLNK